MKWLIAITEAPRKVSTVGITIASLKKSGFDGELVRFIEPGRCETLIPGSHQVHRPAVFAPLRDDITPSPDGTLGCFQNYIQTIRDLSFWVGFDRCLIVQDDTIFCEGIKDFLDSFEWTEPVGAISLYCPHLGGYRSADPAVRNVTRENHVGNLAIAFTAECIRLLSCLSVSEWKGGKHQQGGVAPWERKSCDAWLGKSLRFLGYQFKHISPSLVHHYSPLEEGNSSYLVGNGRHVGPRQAYNFIGESANPKDLFPSLEKV